MSMIERIVKAIDDTYDVDCGGDLLNLPEVARAVLEALREPTPEMVEAVEGMHMPYCGTIEGDGWLTTDSARKAWGKMLDAALAEQP